MKLLAKFKSLFNGFKKNQSWKELQSWKDLKKDLKYVYIDDMINKDNQYSLMQDFERLSKEIRKLTLGFKQLNTVLDQSKLEGIEHFIKPSMSETKQKKSDSV